MSRSREYPIASLVRNRFSKNDGTCCGFNPIYFVLTSRELEHQPVGVTAWDYSISVPCRPGGACSIFAMVKIEGILLTRLAAGPANGSLRNSAHNKSFVGLHLDKVETVNEVNEKVNGAFVVVSVP